MLADLQAFRQRLIAAAIRAPSGDNCQPWIFEFAGDDTLVIGFSPQLAESFFDFSHCGTHISVGAVIENLRIQASREGFRINVEYSDHASSEARVVVRFRPAGAPSSESMSAALFQRTVNRRPFVPVRPSAAKLASLVSDAVPHVSVHIVENRRDISRWGRLIYFADRVRFSHPVIHRELFSKMLYKEARAAGCREGLEVDRLGIGPAAGAIMHFLTPWDRMEKLSRWGLARALSGQSRLLALATGALVLLTISETTAANWVRAGEQMQRLWVGAHAIGLCTHPMPVGLYLDYRYREEGMKHFLPHHKPFLDQLRKGLAELVPQGYGAMLFRLGYGIPMKGPAVRKEVTHFFDPHNAGGSSSVQSPIKAH